MYVWHVVGHSAQSIQRCGAGAAVQQLSHSVESTLGVGGQVDKRPSFGLRREDGASVDVLHAGWESPSAYLGTNASEAGCFAVALPVYVT